MWSAASTSSKEALRRRAPASRTPASAAGRVVAALALAALALILGSCGGDRPSSDAAIRRLPSAFGDLSEPTTMAAVTTPVTTAATVTTRRASTTVVVPSSISAPTSTVAPTAPDDPNSVYCQRARARRQSPKPTAPNSPEALRQSFRDVARDNEAAAAIAPEKIRKETRIVADATTALVAALEKANFEIGKVPPEVLTRFDSLEFKLAIAEIDVYVKNVCGAQ